MHLPSKVFTLKSQSGKWTIKTNGCSDKASPLGNRGTNPKELHTLILIPKKPKGDGGDRKKKLELDKVFYENKAWRYKVLGTFEMNTNVYYENRRNTVIYYNVIFLIGTRKHKIKKNLQKVWVPLFEIQISKLFPIAHTEKFMQ
jgi:hypothetical protein